MTGGTDWVDDGSLSRDEAVNRLTALNPAPTVPDDLHRAVARMAARLILFSDDTTRGEIVDNAALFAAEVIELMDREFWNYNAKEIASAQAASRADERERNARAVEAEIPGGTRHEPSSWARGYQDGYEAGLTNAAKIVRGGSGE